MLTASEQQAQPFFLDNPANPLHILSILSFKQKSFPSQSHMSSCKYQNSSHLVFIFFASDIYPIPIPSRKNRRKKLLGFLATYIISLSLSRLLSFFLSLFLSLSHFLWGVGWISFLFRRLTTFHDENDQKIYRKKQTNKADSREADRWHSSRFVAVHIFSHFIRKGPCSRESKNPSP